MSLSLFLETEEPKLEPKLQPKPHMPLIYFLTTSALESPEMLPKGTSQKGLEEGEWPLIEEENIHFLEDDPQFPSKGGTNS